MAFFGLFAKPKPPEPPEPLPVIEEFTVRTVDVSKMRDDSVLDFADRLNNEGWLVSISLRDAKDWAGYWHGMVFSPGFTAPKPHGSYLLRESTLYLTKPPANVVRTTACLGRFGGHNVIGYEDKLVVGCTSVPAEKAVDLAAAILRHFGALPTPSEALRQRDRLAAEVEVLRAEFAKRHTLPDGGPDAEDGPWAEGWAERAGLLPSEEPTPAAGEKTP